jgi:outer membrane immunogenic protein
MGVWIPDEGVVACRGARLTKKPELAFAASPEPLVLVAIFSQHITSKYNFYECILFSTRILCARTLSGLWKLGLGMHRFAVVGAGLLSIAGFVSAATAADLPAPVYTKAPLAAPITAYNWTGCYIGGHVGGLVSEDRTTGVTGRTVDFSSPGFVGGGQIGCDYQFASGWVVGVEGRAAWTSLKNNHAGTVISFLTGATLPSRVTLRNDFLASTTARLGYSFADRWLVFVRGGAAWTREKIDDAFTNDFGIAADPAATMTRTGWTAGGGVEWAFASQWSATLEYNYYDFGSRGTTLNDTATRTFVTLPSLKDTIHEATVGVNYHF